MQGIKEEIIGKTFGILTVISEDKERNEKEKDRVKNKEIKYPSIYYFAKCGCEKGTIKSYKKGSLLEMNSTHCGCKRRKIEKKIKDLPSYIGITFGELSIISESENKEKCMCLCSCGNTIEKSRTYFKTSKHPSCGCFYNYKNTYKIDYENNIVYGYTTKTNKEFIFDLEDYEKVKRYGWILNSGYVQAKKNGIRLHNLVMNFDLKENKGKEIDHINRNPIDNRKENLRVAKHRENVRNIGIRKNNISGIIGVHFDISKNRWVAHIKYNYKDITLRRDVNKEICIIARLKAEKQYFGEFAPQKHLFEKYNI